jgi:cellulose synthase/poly-beta-1,6-N-acetylglucosamine synthase-like glycosyltransferase
MQKLDIKLIVEVDDEPTTVVAHQVAQDGPFEVLCVPEGWPRTKPRACNYALQFAQGEFTVIYDAEDRPARDQLRKSVAKFRENSHNLACLQARLAFYNWEEGWIPKLFDLDYEIWFRSLLPGLDRLGVPMPLGGTSNHFRTTILRQLGGWDPYNVTEDADLGIRIAQLGKRVSMLGSTTFEEAPTTFKAWTKQRSRWLKGYMQTWLVHTRRPFQLWKRVGALGFFAFHLFVGGAILSALANPFLWLMFALSMFLHWQMPGGALVDSLMIVSGGGLIGGNAIITAIAVISPLRRGRENLAPYGLTVTLYWLLISAAAYRGLHQLIFNTYHWDKTEHGVSRMSNLP